MKKLVLVLTLAATTAFASGDVVRRGAPINNDAKSVQLATVLENPEAYTETPVVVEGYVEKACERKGCWMTLSPIEGKSGIRVTFKDYGFFVPKDSAGMTARAEGVAVTKKLSKEEADHLADEGAQIKRNEDGTALEVSFVANGVELTKK
jgi:hypothetical protein